MSEITKSHRLYKEYISFYFNLVKMKRKKQSGKNQREICFFPILKNKNCSCFTFSLSFVIFYRVLKRARSEKTKKKKEKKGEKELIEVYSKN